MPSFARMYRSVFVAYYAVQQAMSSVVWRVGTVLLISIPLVDLIVGADLITTAAMIGPGAVVIVVVVLAGFHLLRRRRRDG